MSSVLAGVISNTLTHPLWVLKNKLQTGEAGENASKKINEVYTREGLRGFYAGLGLSFVGISHVAIYFPVYEYLKRQLRFEGKDQNSSTEIVGASIGAKFVATAMTYPNTLLMTMKQCEN